MAPRSSAPRGSEPVVDTSEKRWYELVAAAAEAPSETSAEVGGRAAALYAAEVAAWQAAKAQRETGDDRYMAQVVKSGTLSDKVAAMTLLVQESPVHRLETLEGLVGLAKSGKHASKMAIESLRELLGGEELVPGDRRLRAHFGDGSRLELILRCFESKLKAIYGEVASLLEGYAKHQAKELRVFAIETAAQLLAAKPEEEQRLLAALVNKLGDPEGAVSSAACASLCRVLDKHAAMTPVVCAEVQSFVARPNLDGHAVYKAVTFLSQIYLSSELSAVAESLVEMYVALFSREVARGRVKTKLLSALLTGLNRALPYVDRLLDEAAIDSLFLASHAATFAAKVQALSLLERVSADGAPKLRARFVRAVYALMHAQDLRNTTKPTLFLNLAFKTLKADPEPTRLAACLKRLSQLAAHSTSSVAAALVYLFASLRPAPLLAAPSGPDDWRLGIAAKREPAFAATDAARLFELALLRHHYHPSVQNFAHTALHAQPLDYRGDPLDDFTLSSFLDRFAYRNPKRSKSAQRHAKKPRNLTLDLPDFYARYLHEAAATKAKKRRRVEPGDDSALDAPLDDADDVDRADDVDDVSDAVDDADDVDGDDFDDAFDDDAFDDDDEEEDEDDDVEDDGVEAPTPIVVEKDEAEEREKKSRGRRKSPFVDADEFQETLERKEREAEERAQTHAKKRKASQGSRPAAQRRRSSGRKK